MSTALWFAVMALGALLFLLLAEWLSQALKIKKREARTARERLDEAEILTRERY